MNKIKLFNQSFKEVSNTYLKGNELAPLAWHETLLKVASLVLLIPILYLVLHSIVRTYQLLDAKEALEKRFEVSSKTLAKIEALMPKILEGEQDPEIQWLSKGAENRVFTLVSEPNVVFKTPNYQLQPDGIAHIEQRFDQIVQAKSLFMKNNWDLLVLPDAQYLGQGIIAERRLPFTPNEGAQEELFFSQRQFLNEHVRELTQFIIKTGFSDVSWRNIPFEAPSINAPQRIALIDLEEMNGAAIGLLGGKSRRGLINCVFSEVQVDLIIKAAREHNLIKTDEEAQKIKQKRMDEIAAHQKLYQFYRNRRLEEGRAPIRVDLNSLGLDLDKEEMIFLEDGSPKPVTLKKVAEDVIQIINEGIRENSPCESLKEQRSVVVNRHAESILQYEDMFDSDQPSWVHVVLNALQAAGHIHAITQVRNHAYYIQA